jgi:hypothetical protein
VGLALIVWGRRPARAERRVTQVELAELRRHEAARFTARSSLGPLV